MQMEIITEAFKNAKEYYEGIGYSFNYKFESLPKSSDHTAIVSCKFRGEERQFAFTSVQAEPTLREDEYWLVYYYDLPYTSSSPYRGKLIDLSKDLISMLKVDDPEL